MKKARISAVWIALMSGWLWTIPAKSDKYEAESGNLTGTEVAVALPGFSGTGYVTGFDTDADAISIPFSVATPGLYQLSITYAAPTGDRPNLIYINSEGLGSKLFAASAQFKAAIIGNVWLQAGNNVLRVEKEWGNIHIDYMSVEPATPLPAGTLTASLIDKQASKEAKAVWAFLMEMYGKKVLSGQYGEDAEMNYIRAHTGKLPAVRGFDLLSYSAAVAWNDGSTQRIIEWYTLKRGIPTVCWHWFSPMGATGDKSFYTADTDFDLTTALEPTTTEHQLLLRDIDSIATQLKIIQRAGVPVLWRPLHEASEKLFWWGAQGPEACVKLYQLMYDRLTNYHQLHNLIWVWTSADDATATQWYPGDTYVDMIGADFYLKAGDYNANLTTYQNLVSRFGGTKMVGVSENGPLLDPDKMLAQKAGWGWFTTWSGNFILDGTQTSIEQLKKVYSHPYVITLDELPNWKKGSGKKD